MKEIPPPVLSVEQVRRVDRIAIERYGMSSLMLMEHAAAQASRWIIENLKARRRVLVLCGRGNNGGDGLAIARHLEAAGYTVHVLQHGPPEKLSADAAINLRIVQLAGIPITLADTDASLFGKDSNAWNRLFLASDIIIDAMLGSGANGPLRTPYDLWVPLANETDAIKIAIDAVSGIDSSSGERQSIYFDTDITLSFVALKPAMAAIDSSVLFGRTVVLPIGVPTAVLAQL